MSKQIVIRNATAEDMDQVMGMIQELADFERIPNGPKIDANTLKKDGFESKSPAFMCSVAVLDNPDNLVGYAIYYFTYSTWEGRSMCLEDLYIKPSVRGKGYGKLLIENVAQRAYSVGCARLDFHVLKWNPAKTFYESLGAINISETEAWECYRLDKTQLQKMSKTKESN